MAGILDKYKTAVIRHPSWRVYSVIDIINSDDSLDQCIKSEVNLSEFGLKDDIEIYYPVNKPDELTIELLQALLNPDYKDSPYLSVTDCLNLFLDVKQRVLVEGMLMQEILPIDIAADLGYKPSLVETYAALFFDMSVWRSSADKMAYLMRGTVGHDARIKSIILDKGIEYVQVHEYHLPAKIKMEKALATTFGRVYEKSIAMMDSPDIEEQKLAQTWVKRSLEVFDALKSASKADGGIRELTIALQTSKAPDVSVDDLK